MYKPFLDAPSRICCDKSRGDGDMIDVIGVGGWVPLDQTWCEKVEVAVTNRVGFACVVCFSLFSRSLLLLAFPIKLVYGSCRSSDSMHWPNADVTRWQC